MDKIELKDKLDVLGINEDKYSLTGNLKSDRIILFHNYSKWEVFYLDERGGRNDERNFGSEDEACHYIYELFRNDIEAAKRFVAPRS